LRRHQLVEMNIGRLVLLGCFSLARGARPRHVGEKITVMAFSDVHGIVLPGKDASPETIPFNNLQDLEDNRSAEVRDQITTTPVDLLIYGGDMSVIPFGKYKPNKSNTCQPQNEADIRAFIEWFGEITTATKKVLIAGNHDVCLDKNLAQTDDDRGKVQELHQLMLTKNIMYLEDECKLVKIDDSKSVHVLGSPLSACRSSDKPGAFQYYPPEGPEEKVNGSLGQILYKDAIQKLEAVTCPNPIVVIHGPPDNANSNIAFSFSEKQYFGKDVAGTLTDAILDKKPQVVLAGHIHASGDKFGYIFKNTTLNNPFDIPGLFHSGGEAPLRMIAMKRTRPQDREEGGIFTVPPQIFEATSE